MENLLTWERVDSQTELAAVIGGWLVKCYASAFGLGFLPEFSLAFVPDEGHNWKSNWRNNEH